jgi:hypothetical protein
LIFLTGILEYLNPMSAYTRFHPNYNPLGKYRYRYPVFLAYLYKEDFLMDPKKYHLLENS